MATKSTPRSLEATSGGIRSTPRPGTKKTVGATSDGGALVVFELGGGPTPIEHK
jgi:hypothetical protein